MWYMARDPEMRADPRRLLPGAKSVISVALNYFRPGQHGDAPGVGKIHATPGATTIMTCARSSSLCSPGFVSERPESKGKICVDSAPMMDKAWAARAGLGWIGKHTNLITHELGSWVFLGELLLALELEYDSFYRARPLRHMPRLYRRLPNAGDRRALPGRRDAVHLLRHDRAARRRAAREDRIEPGRMALRLRHLPGRLPVVALFNADREPNASSRAKASSSRNCRR